VLGQWRLLQYSLRNAFKLAVLSAQPAMIPDTKHTLLIFTYTLPACDRMVPMRGYIGQLCDAGKVGVSHYVLFAVCGVELFMLLCVLMDPECTSEFSDFFNHHCLIMARQVMSRWIYLLENLCRAPRSTKRLSYPVMTSQAYSAQTPPL